MIKRFFTILFLYTLSFLIINYIKFKGFYYSLEILEFFQIYIFSTFLSSLILRKFSKSVKADFNELSKLYLKAFVLNLGLITLTINFVQEFTSSRILIAGSLTLGFIFEYLYIVINSKISIKSSEKHIFSFSLVFLTIEFIILTWLTFYSFLNYDFTDYSIKQKILFIIILYTIWFVNSSFNRHSDVAEGSTFSRIVWNHVTSYIMLFLIVSSMVFLLTLPIEIKKIVIYNVAIFSLWSFVALIVYYLYRRSPKIDNVTFGLLNATEFPEEFYSDDNPNEETFKKTAVLTDRFKLLRAQLKNIYLKKFPSVFNFLDTNLLLNRYDISNCVILRSADVYNVEVLPDDSVEMYINLHELNDIKRINEYLIQINKRLKQNGYFIGRFQSNHLKYEQFHSRYPFYLANFYYSLDFLWKRVFPKMPFLKKIYQFVSKGKNRALSMAEGLGRLYYCGFQVKTIQEVDGFLYFIAKKNTVPSTDKNPSYGLFFKMRRVGQYGKPISVFKMRTMHPYSEYLQKFVHDNFSLKKGGKFENDFRITSWGRIARKLWIDELPMLFNWLKRELKIVGIRPLSYHFISLYDSEFVKFRNSFKPGLVPPFYADMPKTLVEIQNSEKKYLEKFAKGKFLVDLEYFFKAFFNIVFKKARSS
jgi:lipopolysaccharide/colanic/teichoic acid biosynthesis glycosyltransferase